MTGAPNQFSEQDFEKLKQAARDLNLEVDFLGKSLSEYMKSLEDIYGNFEEANKKAKSQLRDFSKRVRDESRATFSDIKEMAGESAAIMAGSFMKSTKAISSQFNKLGATIKIDNKKIRESISGVFEKGGNGFSALKAGSKEFSRQTKEGFGNVNNQVDMLVKGGEELRKIFEKMDTSASNIARSLNMTYEDAAKVRTALRDSSIASGELSATGESLTKSMVEMNAQLGTSARFNDERLIQFAKLRDVAKFEPEVLEDVNRMSLANNQTLLETTENRLAQINLSKIQLGRQVDEKKVMMDIAKASYNIKLNFLGRDKDLAKAATQARALGMELSQTEKIAEGLMDFEGSIAKQMEAEVLTGQTLNLERARYYALTNDISGVQSELNAQGITAEKFGKMNRIQQSAIAESLGMSKDEMSKMLVEQTALKNLGVGSLLDAQKQYDLAVKNGTVDEFTAKLGDDSLARQFRQQSLQERMNMALEKMLSVFEKLAVVFKPFYEGLVKVAEFLGKSETLLKSILFLVTAIAAKKLLGGIGGGLLSKGATPPGMSVAGLTPAAPLGGGVAAPTIAAAGAAGLGTAGGSTFSNAGRQKSRNAVTKMSRAGGSGAATAQTTAPVTPLTPAQTKLQPFTQSKVASDAIAASVAPKASLVSRLGTFVGQKGGYLGALKSGAGSMMSGAKGLIGKLNPVTALQGAISNAGGPLKLIMKGLKGGAKALSASGLNAIISTLFGIQDFQNLMENPVDEKGELLSKKALSEKAGKIVFSTGGSIVGGAIGAGLGGPIASIVGSLGGQYLMGLLADSMPGLTGTVGQMFVPQEKLDAAPSLYEGGVVTETGLIKAHAGEVYTGGGTLQLFQGMFQEMKTQNAQLMEQNKHLVALVNKSTVLKLDSQVLAQSATRTSATQYGNLLNGNSYV